MPFTDKEIVNLVKKGVAAELKQDSDTRKAITDLVKKGVAAELNAPSGRAGITPAQGAQAAVNAESAIAELAKQVADLTALVKALPAATPAPAGTQPATGNKTPARGRTPTGTRTPSSTRTPTRTRTSARAGAAPSDGRG